MGSVSSAASKLKDVLRGDVRVGEVMARHTSFRIGGPADLFVTCDTIADLTEAIRTLDEESIPWVVLGKGTNVLVADAGYRGAVLTLGREFKKHAIDGERIKVGAACILAYVVRDAFSRGLAGLEFAVGIPGTVGGALAMNAGSRDAWMGSVTESVTVYRQEGLQRIKGREIEWGYRSSGIAGEGIIVEAVLRLSRADPDSIRHDMEAGLKRRKATQPLGLPSAGSVFVNPGGDSAGRLIEAAGLKGTQLGGARISEVHANFIVNTGSATAADVVGLVRKVQVTVRDVHGIQLTPEIRFLGAFDAA